MLNVFLLKQNTIFDLLIKNFFLKQYNKSILDYADFDNQILKYSVVFKVAFRRRKQ